MLGCDRPVLGEANRTVAESETIHLAIHLAQVVTVGLIIFQLAQIYKSVRSRFNLGLVIFAVAMLLEVISGISLDFVSHTVSEILLLIALATFLYTVRK